MSIDELAIALKANLPTYRIERERGLWQIYVPTVNYPIASLGAHGLKFHPATDRAVKANLQVLVQELEQEESANA